MPAVSEQFVSEFIVQGLPAFESAMKSAGGGMDQLEQKGTSIGSSVTSGLGSFFSGFGSNMAAVGTIALSAAGTVVGAIGGIGAAIAKFALDAAPLQAVEGAFAGLAESAGSGTDEMLAALRQGSSGMITNRDLMMSFNQAAQLVSVDFATQLPEAMQYLGKVSAATGQDMGFMLDSLVKGVGRVSPMILDNLGIQVNAVEANEAYALSIGKTAAELDKGEQQAAMMAMVLEKLAINTANMPDITDNASTSLAALKATFKNTKDQIGLTFLPTLNTLMGVISNLADKVLPPLTDFLEGTLAPAFEGVAKFVSNFVEQLGQTEGVWEALTMAFEGTPFEDLQGSFIVIRDAIQGFMDKAREVLTPILEWLAKNVELKDVLLAIGAAIAYVVVPIIGTILGALVPVIATFLAAVAIVALLRTAWETDFMGIQGIVAGAAAWIQTTFETLRAWWAENGDAILAKAKEVWEAVVAAVSTAITAVSTVVQTVVAAITTFWAENGDAILAKASAIWTGILDFISTAITTISTVVMTVVGALQTFWAAHGEAITTMAQTAWYTIKTFIETAITVISEVIQAFMSAIKGDWSAFGEHLRTAVDAVWENIKNIFRNAAANIKLVVSGLITAIKGFFTDTDWGSVGSSVIQGIADGISRAVGFVADAARAAAKAALDAAKGFLGIDSPSKVFRVEVGQASGEGIAEGIADTLPAIRAQLGALVPLATTAGSVINYSTVNNLSSAYQLTTQSMTREGALRMEFAAMAAAGRIAA